MVSIAAVPLELHPGVANRLRLIALTGDRSSLAVQLLDGFDPIQWTLIANASADIAVPARRSVAARQAIGTCQIYDFELAPLARDPGSLWLELRRGTGEVGLSVAGGHQVRLSVRFAG